MIVPDWLIVWKSTPAATFSLGLTQYHDGISVGPTGQSAMQVYVFDESVVVPSHFRTGQYVFKSRDGYLYCLVMDRRRFLIGVGAVVAGGTPLMATRADPSGGVDRKNVDVETDLFGDKRILLSTDIVGGAVKPRGEKLIDMGTGVNVGGIYRLGERMPAEPTRPPDPAALIFRTDHDQPQRLWLGWRLANDDWVGDAHAADWDGSTLTFRLFAGDGHELDRFTIPADKPVMTLGPDAPMSTSVILRPDQPVYVTIVIDTTGKQSTPQDDFSGKLRISSSAM